MWLIYSSVQPYFQKCLRWLLFSIVAYVSKTIWLWSDTGSIALKLLALSWRRPLSYRNESTDLLCKSMDWFLYDSGLRHEKVKEIFQSSLLFSRNHWNCNENYLFMVQSNEIFTNFYRMKPLSYSLIKPYVNSQKMLLYSSGIYLLNINSVWNMFKVNKKDTRTMPSFWCLYC